jgi:hypothetical protein
MGMCRLQCRIEDAVAIRQYKTKPSAGVLCSVVLVDLLDFSKGD